MATITPSQNNTSAASCVGVDLKAARERLGRSLQDVALGLRIRPAYLEALEQGRISALPGHTYAVAFMRSYAHALGLDAEAVIHRFKTEEAAVGQHSRLVFPAPMPERALPGGAVALLGLVLAVGAYVGWYRLSGEGRLPAETVMAIPEHLAPLADQALPLTPNRSIEAQTDRPPQNPLAEPAFSDDRADPAPPVMAISPTSAAAAQLPPRPASPPTRADPSPMSGAADASRIILRVNADSWLMVKDRSGTVLLNRTMKTGETWSVPPRPDLLLTTGNAAGTEVVVDGATTPSLGGFGGVRRDLPLDADQIKAGKLSNGTAAPLAAIHPHP